MELSMSQADILNALSDFHDPYRGRINLVDRGEVSVQGDTVTVQLGYAAEGCRAAIEKTLREALAATGAKLVLGWAVKASPVRSGLPGLAGVKNIIAVASGKGGVGKSSTAVNLALALQAEGARVGILDADIYGPSQQMMLGVPADHRPEVIDQQFFEPVQAHGLQSMSMAYLVTEKTPMVWRGPMASGALQQMLQQTRWNDLDYLIVDMPPGTGDIQLTLSQKVPVTGTVIVTTPQDIALLDAKKGIEMFRKVDISVLGVIENMALHICPKCSHESHVFGEGGGDRIAKEYGVPLLGSLPLDIRIREQLDAGVPTVAADPDGPIAAHYREIARKLGARIAEMALQQKSGPRIVISND
ncbi:MAG: iron-sulfur cluster carrier protein ApbC [Gammaproteobacteria bacterium]|nr:MAG: iron-sulfur cluster carrier protein ApbC [Gammaproteobacteria bacterium]